MTRYTLALLTLVLAAASEAASASSIGGDADMNLAAAKPLFESWMAAHGKKYETDEEAKKRLSVWKDNHGKRSIGGAAYLILSAFAISYPNCSPQLRPTCRLHHRAQQPVAETELHSRP